MVSDNEESMSRIVVSNVQVLTAGTRYDQEASRQDGKPIQTTVVTLAVTPTDAERIALAANGGQIVLALRNPLDVESVATSGVRLATLMNGQTVSPPVVRSSGPKKVVAAPPPSPPPPVTRIYTVEAIRAAKRSEEPVR
jgi:pilus assembly protein CpaB